MISMPKKLGVINFGKLEAMTFEIQQYHIHLEKNLHSISHSPPMGITVIEIQNYNRRWGWFHAFQTGCSICYFWKKNCANWRNEIYELKSHTKNLTAWKAKAKAVPARVKWSRAVKLCQTFDFVRIKWNKGKVKLWSHVQFLHAIILRYCNSFMQKLHAIIAHVTIALCENGVIEMPLSCQSGCNHKRWDKDKKDKGWGHQPDTSDWNDTELVQQQSSTLPHSN